MQRPTKPGLSHAAVVIAAATALSLLVAALILRRFDFGDDLIVTAVVACPLVGLLFGAPLGAAFGRRAFLYPALIPAILYAVRGAAGSGDFQWASLFFMAFLMPPGAVIGVLLGGWLEGLPQAKGKPRPHGLSHSI